MSKAGPEAQPTRGSTPSWATMLPVTQAAQSRAAAEMEGVVVSYLKYLIQEHRFNFQILKVANIARGLNGFL